MKYYKNFDLEDIVYLNDNNIKCTEQWKDVENYEGLYKISDLGRIKSLNRYCNSKNNSLKHISQKIMKCYIHKGYLKICLGKNQKHHHFIISRLVATAFIPNPENKPEVNHIKGNKFDNRAIELEWCTKSENIKHAFMTGLKVTRKGEKCNFSKLTEKEVLEIRKINKSMSMIDIGKKYDIARATVYDILKRRRWTHI